MSNIDPENPNPISQTSAGRIVGSPRNYNTATFGDLATILSQMAAINDRIRINTESMASFFTQHARDQNMVRSVSGAGGRVPGLSDPIMPSDLRSPRLRAEFDQQKRQLIDEISRLDAEAQRKRLQAVGVPPAFIPPGTPSDFLSGSGQESRLLQSGLEGAVASGVLQGASIGDVKEAMGLRRLQDLNVKSNFSGSGILKRFGGMLGMGGAMGGGHAHTTDPLQAALEQKKADEDRAAGRIYIPNRGLGDKAADVLGSAMMRGGIGGGIASVALKAFPLATAALVVPELLRHFGINVPSIAQVPDALRAGRLTGQLTGEGVGAGIGASLDARRIRSGGLLFAGLNPFDPITSEIANQIVTSVRTEGFTGDKARNLYQTVASVYRDLGLSIETTTKIIADATRVGGESLKQISDELHGFDDAAHSLQMNINQYAESIMQVSTGFRAAGGGSLSTRAAQSFIAGAPRILREGGGLAQYQQIYQNAQPFLAAQLGIPIQYLGLRGNLPHTIDAFQNQLVSEISRMPGDSLEEKAANASRFGILFKGTDVPNIVSLVTQIQKGRGPSNVMHMEQIRAHLNNQTTHSELEAYVTNPYARGDKVIGHRQVMVATTGDALRQAQVTALRQLSPYLSVPQRARLQKLIGNQHDFQQAIQEMEGQQRNQTGKSVNINGVTISLSRGASKILRLDVNKEQVRQGTRPANRTYESETDRTFNPADYSIP